MFLTPVGRFVLPFRISSAPGHYQRKMYDLLLIPIHIYTDDVVIFGETQEVHGNRLQGVLKHIQEELTLNKAKCKFRYTLNRGNLEDDPT